MNDYTVLDEMKQNEEEFLTLSDDFLWDSFEEEDTELKEAYLKEINKSEHNSLSRQISTTELVKVLENEREKRKRRLLRAGKKG